MQPSSAGRSAKSVAVIILLSVGLVGTLTFGVWAFTKMQSYKSISDETVAGIVEEAKKKQASELQKQFDEQSKKPYKTFKGSSTYGTISFNYPRSWSAYVDESGSGELINGYFYPNIVPGTSGDVAYALRLELLDTKYNDVISQFKSQVTQGDITASAYVPPKMKGVANIQPGTKLKGEINSSNGAAQHGSVVLIKVRDKTLKISTQSTDFLGDFNDVVLSSLTFVP
jgi:hypothetical protein